MTDYFHYTTIRPALRKMACCFSAFLLLSFCSIALAKEQEIVIPPWEQSDNKQNIYLSKLLRLVLKKTEATDGTINIKYFSESYSLTRFLAELKNNRSIDVIWNGTSNQREKDLLAIKIPLIQEFTEYRVLMIRKEDQSKFSNIKTLSDLQKFTAGTGSDWPSGDILRRNSIPTITINNSNKLFAMLKAKRFDFISRNTFEAWDEEKQFKADGLAVETTLLLHGGARYYYFVNKENKALADRIQRGLTIAIADGSYNELLFSTSEFHRGNEEVHSKGRRIIELNAEQ